ncbi:integrase family protein, partial [Natronorubrum sulfidifaciens JCM 14089]
MATDTDSNIRAKVWLEPDQVEALRNVCYDDEFASYLQQRNDAIIALLYDAGLRVGELVQVDVGMLREGRNDAIIALLYDAGLRVGELVQVDVGMLREGRSELYLPAPIQKDYPNDNSPTAVTMELGNDTSRTLNSYLTSR